VALDLQEEVGRTNNLTVALFGAQWPVRPPRRCLLRVKQHVPAKGDQTVHAPSLAHSRIMPRLADDAESRTGTTLALEAERAALLAEQRLLLQEQAILQRTPPWNTKATRVFLKHLTDYEKRFRAFLRKLEPPG
jgi:hypothetical protein